ncbi:uncharacterized protein MELLADRAFT_114282 [Melampsora larici-populina 98AG31]|uniref:Uncharacterized protein n=1 Tax=Melampsora larici-populina (strain 98AG31 / pathotype 3-4-7) TaxID=747676 RepID=F4SCW5_MELLP|nr:uncharacterized protein MELLADRAFT_114282 [Melampsora larici-populina 98AG31]EGF97510.1 hypothetical protein MELLADRAFT_114282 [Melampsora larici-populina 98AG31]
MFIASSFTINHLAGPGKSRYWKKGAPPKSTKALNASISGTIPKSTASISMCIATFTRTLLGYDSITKAYPLSPTPQELAQLPSLEQQYILSDQRVIHADLIETGDTNMTRSMALFSADLRNHGIHRVTFDWNAPNNSHWNRTMAIFVAKHWMYSRTRGLFKEKSVNKLHCTEFNCISLVLRWVRGRSEEIRNGRRSPAKRLKKETGRKKKQLFEYRHQSLSRLLGSEESASELMPDSDCCSETEWQPEETQYKSIGLIWRSSQYSQILHQIDKLSFRYKASIASPLLASRRFDQCRTKATEINWLAPVCCGLPENCYEQVFLAKLTDEARTALNVKPPSDALNTLPPMIVSSLL